MCDTLNESLLTSSTSSFHSQLFFSEPKFSFHLLTVPTVVWHQGGTCVTSHVPTHITSMLGLLLVFVQCASLGIHTVAYAARQCLRAKIYTVSILVFCLSPPPLSPECLGWNRSPCRLSSEVAVQLCPPAVSKKESFCGPHPCQHLAL